MPGPQGLANKELLPGCYLPASDVATSIVSGGPRQLVFLERFVVLSSKIVFPCAVEMPMSTIGPSPHQNEVARTMTICSSAAIVLLRANSLVRYLSRTAAGAASPVLGLAVILKARFSASYYAAPTPLQPVLVSRFIAPHHGFSRGFKFWHI